MTQQRLDDAGIDVDEVTLFRYSDGGEWSALETEHVGTADDGSLRFRATSPGLSVFAIGSRQAQQQQTEEPPEQTTDAPAGDDGLNVTLVAAIVVILAIVVAAGAYWYRREQ